MPWPLQLGLLAALTFVSEDAAVLAGAFLGVSGMAEWEAVFASCFLGIWAGDQLLYAVGRWWGRPLLQKSLVRRWIPASVWERGEACVAERGVWALVLCRFVPGTRLPVYLMSGVLRLPFRRFAWVTALLAAAWLLLIFGLVQMFGLSVGDWLREAKRQTVAALGVCLLLAAVLGGLRLGAGRWQARGIPASLARFRHWEFWPSWLFYLPVGMNYLRLAVKYRGLYLPALANPGMFAGGLIGESKYDILRGLMRAAPACTAASALVHEGRPDARFREFLRKCGKNGWRLPVVLKPDVGQRGSGFKVVRRMEEAAHYLATVQGTVVLQEYVPGPHEAGIFYYRFPHEPCGRIFAITEKLFPVLFGDGVRTVEQLIRDDARASLMAGVYRQRWAERLGEVLPFGQSLRLVEAGNHAQGCIFRDGMHLWSEQLEARIDDISRGLEGFYIGRYDVRYESAAALKRGEGFKILELNGASSEATSIYDARNSLFQAYRVLFRQWELVFAIGAANRALGVRGDSWVDVWRSWKRYETTRASHPVAD